MDRNAAGQGPLERPVRPHCPDCQAKIGTLHKYGCDVERCPDCGGQYISCGCKRKRTHPRLGWTGHWPGEAECHEFQWFSRWVDGRGWVPCEATDPGSGPNLNRLPIDAVWDPLRGRWVRPNA